LGLLVVSLCFFPITPTEWTGKARSTLPNLEVIYFTVSYLTLPSYES
jgi:hypothetical protein